MKYLADTHMHSIFSYDGQMSLEDMVRKGKEYGLKYMAFTEHLELGQIKISQFVNRYKIYSDCIDRLQEEHSGITLIKGVEFSNPEMYPKELEIVNNMDIDYIIGSNHILPSSDSEKEILLYYKRILMMIKNGGIDSLGHMDYIRRKYDDRGVPLDIIREIYSLLIDKGITLEINSSARRRKGLDSFPSKDKLVLYKEMGGDKVTIGSDAHRLNEIYDNIDCIDSEYDFNKGLYLKRKFVSISHMK